MVGRMFHIDDDGAITDVHACHINGPTDHFWQKWKTTRCLAYASGISQTPTTDNDTTVIEGKIVQAIMHS